MPVLSNVVCAALLLSASLCQAQWTWSVSHIIFGNTLRLTLQLESETDAPERLGQFNLRAQSVSGIDTTSLPVLRSSLPAYAMTLTPREIPSLWQVNAVLDQAPGEPVGTVHKAICSLDLPVEAFTDSIVIVLQPLQQTFLDDRVTPMSVRFASTRIAVALQNSAVDDNQMSIGRWRLTPGYPSPFHNRVQFVLETGRPLEVHAEIYDTSGRRVSVFPVMTAPQGRHVLHWDGISDDGRVLPSGVYVLRVAAGRRMAVRKIIKCR